MDIKSYINPDMKICVIESKNMKLDDVYNSQFEKVNIVLDSNGLCELASWNHSYKSIEILRFTIYVIICVIVFLFIINKILYNCSKSHDLTISHDLTKIVTSQVSSNIPINISNKISSTNVPDKSTNVSINVNDKMTNVSINVSDKMTNVSISENNNKKYINNIQI